jgi:cyclopropane fatty-acyl-phospholipid synthase-like methyltransferase
MNDRSRPLRPDSRRSASYDLSNVFYALFLDPEMVYSCAYFTDWGNDLATAQHDKLDMICRKLRLQPGDTFLDIGCGWGALVCHAARHYGVRARGVTLAEQQIAAAKDKIICLSLQDRVTVELADYAKLEGSYDKIALIGMFEHVGLRNHPTYFHNDTSALEAARALSASRDCATFNAQRQELSQEARAFGASALHLPGRRSRPSRHVDRKSRAAQAPIRRGSAQRRAPAHPKRDL